MLRTAICITVCFTCINHGILVNSHSGAILSFSNNKQVGGTYVAKCYTSDRTVIIKWIKQSTIAGVQNDKYNVTSDSGEILYPFNMTGRYSLNETIHTKANVMFDMGDKVSVLTIKNLQDVDTGKITCKIGIQSHTFIVTVFSPVVNVKVRGITPRSYVSGSSTILVNSTDLIGCEATAGRYTPTLNITLDGRKLPIRYTLSIVPPGYGSLALHGKERKVIKLADFKPNVTYNGKTFTCSALANNTNFFPQPVVASVILKVQGVAYIECKDIHPTITCNVTVNPTPFCGTGCSVTWTWKNTSIEVPLNSNTTVGGYLATSEYVNPLAERYEINLTLPNTQEKFRPTFKLNVTNAIGSNTIDVTVTYPITSLGSKTPSVLHGLLTVAILLGARNI